MGEEDEDLRLLVICWCLTCTQVEEFRVTERFGLFVMRNWYPKQDWMIHIHNQVLFRIFDNN